MSYSLLEGIDVLPNTRLVWTDGQTHDKEVSGAVTLSVEGSFDIKDRAFLLVVNGRLMAPREHKEINLLVAIGDALEYHYRKQRGVVWTLRLPQSHGYSGNWYGYNRTKELFPHAGLDRRTSIPAMF